MERVKGNPDRNSGKSDRGSGHKPVVPPIPRAVFWVQRSLGNDMIERLSASFPIGITATAPPTISRSPDREILRRAVKSVAPTSKGFLEPIHSDGSKYPPVPDFLRVDHTHTSGNREYFKFIEAGRNGKYLGTTASLPKKDDGGSYLLTGVAYGSPGQIKYNKSTNKLRIGGGRGFTVNAITDHENPVPNGNHDLEIPYEVHPKGTPYLGAARYSRTWFRIGHSGDRFLHTGAGTLGCTTVTDTHAWDAIYRYLIKRRLGDNKSVGTLEVTS